MEYAQDLKYGMETAFLQRQVSSDPVYHPEFISNNAMRGRRVISTLEQELNHCDEFFFSVAFVTSGGITPLLLAFQELEQRGVKGKILTTDYEMFNDPQALDRLHRLGNIEVRMFRTDGEQEGFHTKGYIFRQKDLYRIVIGSSNMTASALKVNHEWNTKLVGYESGELIGDVLDEFRSLWQDPRSLPYDEFIEDYRVRYELTKRQREIARQASPVSLEQYRLKPNKMQTAFVKNLKELIESGESRALLISATGTGKTYASAFGLREMHPRRVLFVVHRERIAAQALESYRKVFGTRKEDGTEYRYMLLSGTTSKDLDEVRNADLLFATMQTLHKDSALHALDPRAFTAICLDEAHHSGAFSYRKIMEYFKPDFWLGMTASPDTNRFDVYEIFDHNIAYEIRLQQALEENLLCPFHYFGITDLCVDGKVIGDTENTDGLRYFSRLVSDDRVDYVIRQAQYYGYSGDRVKGLVFCSRKDEARELSRKFNERGFRTKALTGEDRESERAAAIEQLIRPAPEGGAGIPDCLDYIFTVDIFSEGVDIPEINQVIMLRPTQSAIVFVQQLGRGLRKSPGKEYVVILDFIGNYRSNFLIPIALSGDRSYNKDNVRRYVMEGDRVIPGASTVHFDRISRNRIYAAIDEANFSDIKLIRENYVNLKNKLGRIPRLMDFDAYGEMDVCRIFDNNSLGSYYRFLVKYEPEYTVRLPERAEKMVEFISRKLASGKRIHELALLDLLLTEPRRKTPGGVLAGLRNKLEREYGIPMDASAEQSVVNVMTNEFPAGSARPAWRECVFLEPDGSGWRISEDFSGLLENTDFRDMVRELVDFGVSRYERDFSDRYGNTNFALYQKYTYEDVCRLLNWEHNEVPLNIGGYKYDRKTKTLPVFINYEKPEDITDTTKYEDRFVNANTLIAISKSGRHKASEDVQNFLRAEERGIDVHLFVRKNKDDRISKEFYYLGRMTASGTAEEFQMPNTTKTAVEIEWLLDVPVRDDLYQYITT